MTTWSEVPTADPGWFQQVPFGIFLHWGAYSVPGWAEPIGALGEFDRDYWERHCPYAEWYGHTIRVDGSPAQRHHHEQWHDRPYDDFLALWTAEHFDPDAWMDLFARAGAGYVVPTTKHHDGITLWDATGTGTRNTVHRGPRRDLVGDLADAARRRDLKVGLYYSGGIDWNRCGWTPAGADHRAQGRDYADYAFDQCVELVDRYRPDILWDDIDWPEVGKGEGPKDLPALFQHFREVVPHGLVNDRWGTGVHDYRTSEYEAGREAEQAPVWEHCRGIGFSFGWNQLETPEQYLSGHEIARLLVDIASRGGHLLLNLGPRADGTLEPLQVRPMEELATWMADARSYVRIPASATTPPAERTGHWERRIAQPDGRVAVFLDDADRVRLPGADAVAGCRVDGDSVLLDADRTGPAICLVDG